MAHIKSITVKVHKSKSQIIFRALVTILEVVAAVLVTLSPELSTPEKIAIASAVGAAISAVVNILKESGLLELMGGVSDGA